MDVCTPTHTLTLLMTGNPGPGLRQAQICGGVKPVKDIPTLPS